MAKGKTLSRADILGASDRPTEVVPCPEWGGDVIVRTMSGAERDAYEGECLTIRGKSVEINRANARGRLLVRCLVDEAGDPLFKRADADELGAKSGAVLDRLFAVAQRLNGVTKADVDELAKN